jgi:hypothetical protein
MKTKLFTFGLFFVVCMSSHSQINVDTANKHTDNITQNIENSPTDGRISLRLAGNGSFVTILIGFIPEGTVNFDDGYDGPFINDGQTIEFYSFLGAMRLSIQALPELTNVDMQVPLGYELTSDGSYTISIDAEFLDPNFDIILEDTYQSISTDLRQTGYTFSGITGETHDRFFLNLVYRNTLNVDEFTEASQTIHAYFSGNYLKLHTKRTDISKVTVFTTTGKQLSTSDFTQKIMLPKLSHGIYIARFTTTSGAHIIKKIKK